MLKKSLFLHARNENWPPPYSNEGEEREELLSKLQRRHSWAVPKLMGHPTSSSLLTSGDRQTDIDGGLRNLAITLNNFAAAAVKGI